MSYRNPPIIVNKSGDIWAKAISGFAESVANGMIEYSEARKAEIEATKKSRQAMQSFSFETRDKYSDELRDNYIAVKKKNGNTLAEKFKAQATELMYGKGTVGEDDYVMGAVDASVQLKFNTDLSSKEKAVLQKKIDDSRNFQVQGVENAVNIKTGVDNVKSQRVNSEGYPGGYSWKGKDNIERFKTQVAYYAYDDEAMISPGTIEEYDFKVGENGENFFTAKTLIPVKDLDDGPLAKYLTPEELAKIQTVEKDDKKYYEFEYKKDANLWDGEFINNLSALPEYSKAYNIAGVEDKNADVTAKYSANLNTVNSDKGEEYNQDIINLTDVKTNNVLYAEMMGEAAAILEGSPEEIQANLQFGTNRSTLTYSSFLKENPDLESQKKFITDALMQNSIDTRFSQYLQRKATPEDVSALKISNPNTNLQVGQDILYKTQKTSKIEEPEEALTKEPTEGQLRRSTAVEDAPTFYDDMFKKPESFFMNKTMNDKKISKVMFTSGEDSILVDGVQQLPRGEKSKGVLKLGYETGKSTSTKGQVIYEEDMTFDLDDPTRVRALIDMLPNANDEMKRELKKILESKSSDLPIL
jgi:hypothetical protein